MRTLITLAALALALFYVDPLSSSEQPPGADRYSAAGEEPAQAGRILEELPATAADSASPSAPLQQPLNLPDHADQQFDLNSLRGQTRRDASPATPLPAGSETPPTTRGAPFRSSQPTRDAPARQPSEAATGSPPVEPRTSTKDLLAEMLTPPSGAELEGEPVSLGDAMEGIYGRDRQMEVVSAYWQLTVAVAKYYVASRARTAAGSETFLRESHLEAVRAQHKLAQALQWEPGRLPLPTSQPHSGSYKTRYEDIFVGRASRRAWELDQTLPLLYEVVKAHAHSLTGNRMDTAYTSNAHRFLDVVREYNLAIAEYALLATGDTLPGRDLVPLLIRVDREEEDDHVAGQRNRLGRTSSLPPTGSPAAGPRRAIRDPQVVRTAGEQPTTTTDQWRERNPSRSP